MKKIFILLLLISFAGNAQEFGAYKFKAKKTYNPKNKVYNTWLKDPEGGYIYLSEVNVMVMEKFSDAADQVLAKNDMLSDDPVSDTSIIGEELSTNATTERLFESIQAGRTKLIKRWQLGELSFILNLQKDLYYVKIIETKLL